MYKTLIRPRYSENDAAGHINNTVYAVWFEDARREIFKLFVPDLAPAPWNLLLVQSNITYKAEVTWVELVEVSTWVARVGNSSFTLYEEMRQEGTSRRFPKRPTFKSIQFLGLPLQFLHQSSKVWKNTQN
ncbi:acyl-CoA thioesterase [Corynebacterium camporealensis]|uniref:acyl-CoA thioesterase n=1 Tax=Corynebacterium camporealensis TaxID=161896 RepID=UPI000CF8CBEA